MFFSSLECKLAVTVKHIPCNYQAKPIDISHPAQSLLVTLPQSNKSGLYLCIKAQNALPSLQADVMLLIFTPSYPDTEIRHHSSSAGAPDLTILVLRS